MDGLDFKLFEEVFRIFVLRRVDERVYCVCCPPDEIVPWALTESH